MCLDSSYQSSPPASSLDSLDFQVFGSNCNQVQGSHITQVEEWKCEDTFDIYSLFQNPLCQHVVPSLLNDFQSTNLSSQSIEVNFLNQSIVLENHHSDDDEYVDAYDDE